MIDISKFKFGDIVYEVNEHNNSFSKKKLKMIDAEGNEWFRYDRPQYEYPIHELVYCGKVIMVVSGDVYKDNIYETQYHFRCNNNEITYEYEGVIPKIDYWFATKEEAEAYAAAESSRKNDI